jgi:hypothetical protein
MSSDHLLRLRGHLDSLSVGVIQDTRAVVAELELVSDELEGSGLEGMTAAKLHRIESVEWHPPVLSFWLERHGGTVMGSTRAEMHRWTVDLDSGIANCEETGRYRQLYDRDKPLRVEPLVAGVVGAIGAVNKDPRLKWYADGTVRVLVSSLVSGEFKQTVSGRRRRFREALDRELRAIGWTRLTGKLDTYQKVFSDPK